MSASTLNFKDFLDAERERQQAIDHFFVQTGGVEDGPLGDRTVSQLLWEAEAHRRWSNAQARLPEEERKDPLPTAEIEKLTAVHSNNIPKSVINKYAAQMNSCRNPVGEKKQRLLGLFPASNEVEGTIQMVESSLAVLLANPEDSIMQGVVSKLKPAIDSLRTNKQLTSTSNYPHVNTLWELYCFGRLNLRLKETDDVWKKAKKAGGALADGYCKEPFASQIGKEFCEVWKQFKKDVASPDATRELLFRRSLQCAAALPVSFTETARLLQQRFPERAVVVLDLKKKEMERAAEEQQQQQQQQQQPDPAAQVGEKRGRRSVVAEAEDPDDSIINALGVKTPARLTLPPKGNSGGRNSSEASSTFRRSGGAGPGLGAVLSGDKQPNIHSSSSKRVTIREDPIEVVEEGLELGGQKKEDDIVDDDFDAHFNPPAAPQQKRARLELVIPKPQVLQPGQSSRPTRAAVRAPRGSGGGGAKNQRQCNSQYHDRFGGDKHASRECPFCSTCHMMEFLFNGARVDCSWKHKPKSAKQVSTHLKHHPVVLQEALLRFNTFASAGYVEPKELP